MKSEKSWKLDEKEILKNLKMNFFLNKEENFTALQKSNVKVKICRGNKQFDL